MRFVRSRHRVIRSAPWRAQSGVGLIEVLIALIVMAVGILGIIALQATALRNGQSSSARSAAVIQAYSILDAIRADKGAKTDYTTYNTSDCEAPADTATLRNQALSDWSKALKENLGDTACGKIACTKDGACTVEIIWDDSRAKKGSETQTLTTKTKL